MDVLILFNCTFILNIQLIYSFKTYLRGIFQVFVGVQMMSILPHNKNKLMNKL